MRNGEEKKMRLKTSADRIWKRQLTWQGFL